METSVTEQEEANVKTTVAEYLVAGVLKSAEGVDSFYAAAAHDVDVNLVALAHGEASTDARVARH